MGTSVKIDTSNLATQSSVNAIPTNPRKVRRFQMGNTSTTSVTTVTLLNVSGVGVLNKLLMSTSGTGNGHIELVVDGTAYAFASSNGALYYTGINGLSGIAGLQTSSVELNIEFKTSLQINVYADSSTTVNIEWGYSLE